MAHAGLDAVSVAPGRPQTTLVDDRRLTDHPPPAPRARYAERFPEDVVLCADRLPAGGAPAKQVRAKLADFAAYCYEPAEAAAADRPPAPRPQIAQHEAAGRPFGVAEWTHFTEHPELRCCWEHPAAAPEDVTPRGFAAKQAEALTALAFAPPGAFWRLQRAALPAWVAVTAGAVQCVLYAPEHTDALAGDEDDEGGAAAGASVSAWCVLPPLVSSASVAGCGRVRPGGGPLPPGTGCASQPEVVAPDAVPPQIPPGTGCASLCDES